MNEPLESLVKRASTMNMLYHISTGAEVREPFGLCPDRCRSGFVFEYGFDGEIQDALCLTCNGEGFIPQSKFKPK